MPGADLERRAPSRSKLSVNVTLATSLLVNSVWNCPLQLARVEAVLVVGDVVDARLRRELADVRNATSAAG